MSALENLKKELYEFQMSTIAEIMGAPPYPPEHKSRLTKMEERLEAIEQKLKLLELPKGGK